MKSKVRKMFYRGICILIPVRIFGFAMAAGAMAVWKEKYMYIYGQNTHYFRIFECPIEPSSYAGGLRILDFDNL